MTSRERVKFAETNDSKITISLEYRVFQVKSDNQKIKTIGV